MGILIRSAHIEHQPVVLPLFPEQRAVPAAIPAELAKEERHTEAPFPNEGMEKYVVTPLTDEWVPSAEDSTEYEALPQPDLDPVLKQSLLAEIASAREASVKEGYEAGLALGRKESEKLYQERLDALQNILDSATEALQTQIAGVEDIVVALGFETVCKILGDSLLERESVVAVVRQVISHVKESEPITIRLAPADYNQLADSPSELSRARFSSGITLQPDDRVVLGGCLIETSGGSLDGRLETQLQQVKDALLNAQRQRIDWKDAVNAV